MDLADRLQRVRDRRKRDRIIARLVYKRIHRHGVKPEYGLTMVIIRCIVSYTMQVLCEQMPTTVDRMLKRQRLEAPEYEKDLAHEAADMIVRRRNFIRLRRSLPNQWDRLKQRKKYLKRLWLTDEETATLHRLMKIARADEDEDARKVLAKCLEQLRDHGRAKRENPWKEHASQ